jgi:general secretion pathway protein N
MLFAVALFPARLAWQWAGASLADLDLSGIDGTLWSGAAHKVRFQEIPLGEATWRWRPLALLTGEMGVALTLSTARASVSGNLGRGLRGLTGSDLRFSMPVAELISRYPDAGNLRVTVDGRIDGDLARIQLGEQGIERIEGRLDIAGLMLGDTPIGDVRAELKTQDGEVIAYFRSQAGSPATLEGVGALALNGEGYRLDLRVVDPQTLGKELEGLYRSFAKRTDDGGWRLSWQGGP